MFQGLNPICEVNKSFVVDHWSGRLTYGWNLQNIIGSTAIFADTFHRKREVSWKWLLSSKSMDFPMGTSYSSMEILFIKSDCPETKMDTENKSSKLIAANINLSIQISMGVSTHLTFSRKYQKKKQNPENIQNKIPKTQKIPKKNPQNESPMELGNLHRLPIPICRCLKSFHLVSELKDLPA